MGRWSTQLGVFRKAINGQTVGYVVGFCDEGNFGQSIRGNCLFPTEQEARKVLESIERNTQPASLEISYAPIELGEHRSQSGGRGTRWFDPDEF